MHQLFEDINLTTNEVPIVCVIILHCAFINFYDPGMKFEGILFLACLCLLNNFNLDHSFKLKKKEPSYFGCIFTKIMKLSQMTLRLITLWLVTFPLKIAVYNFVDTWGIRV